MRILYIVPYVPNLIRVRPYNLIRNLSRRGHQVTLATLWTTEEERESIGRLESELDRIITFPLSRWRSMGNCAFALPTSQPLQAAYCWNPDLAHNLLHILRDRQEGDGFDVIHIEHLRGAQYGLWLRQNIEKDHREKRSRPPMIWDSVDSISSLFRQTSTQSERWFNRWLARVELRRTESYERMAIAKFDRILVTSKIDRQAFLDLDLGNHPQMISVLANGVDLDYFHPGGENEREPATLVIHGKMSYHANVTMVLRLVREILPQVWGQNPQVKLIIVGKDPPGEVQELARNPSIVVAGTVEDIRPYLRKATLAVAPVVYGAGIQNKVLEAMACATAVIASSQAVSALEIEAGRDVVVADDPGVFSQAILDLLADPKRRQSLGQAGRRYVETHHAWGKIAAKLEDIYMSAIEETESICKDETARIPL